MFGLVVLLAIGVYLLISIAVVLWVVRYAKKQNKGTKRWAWSAALVMFLIPFWDWIPTVATHQYYCSTEAGFWVYKTPEQWVKENPGVMETLVANEIQVPASSKGDQNNWTHVFELNQRFNKVTSHSGPLFLHRWGYESTVIDARTNDVLAKYVNFYTAQSRDGGGWYGWKFWLATDHCPSNRSDATLYANYLAQVKGAKK